jgi:hypothetical protein
MTKPDLDNDGPDVALDHDDQPKAKCAVDGCNDPVETSHHKIYCQKHHEEAEDADEAEANARDALT